ncbi:MAG: hypothetical protein MZW92_31290 [Comamonadaceae bacterium]|nr:hypothetical protein [Comamonadaceae bacterium]
MAYYPTNVIRDRILDCFGGNFEFRINHVVTDDFTVNISGQLTLHWVDGSSTTTEDFGSADLLTNSSGTTRVGDPFKAAVSDLWKRVAASVGIGNELWDADYRESLKNVPQTTEGDGTASLQRFSRRAKVGA